MQAILKQRTKPTPQQLELLGERFASFKNAAELALFLYHPSGKRQWLDDLTQVFIVSGWHTLAAQDMQRIVPAVEKKRRSRRQSQLRFSVQMLSKDSGRPSSSVSPKSILVASPKRADTQPSAETFALAPDV